MIRYEVRLTVAPGREDEVTRYMLAVHIPAIVGTGCFRQARFERLDGDASCYRTCYEAATRADLERYLRDHAARFRAEFVRDLGEAAAATREVWAEVGVVGGT